MLTFTVGGVEALQEICDKSVSTVLAANVLAYFEASSVDLFYKEAHRILRPGGNLIVIHSNELFDMFTLNSLTVDFFSKHFGVNISSLLVAPTLPIRRKLPYRENPLNYSAKMASWGFVEEKQEFAIHHESPPLLNPSFDPDDLTNRRISSCLNLSLGERWKRIFTCSIFGSLLKKSYL